MSYCYRLMKPIRAKYSNNKVAAQGHLLVFSPISQNINDWILLGLDGNNEISGLFLWGKQFPASAVVDLLLHLSKRGPWKWVVRAVMTGHALNYLSQLYLSFFYFLIVELLYLLLTVRCQPQLWHQRGMDRKTYINYKQKVSRERTVCLLSDL